MNVVIVDDDINIRKSLELSLGNYDEFNIKSYKNAKDALKGINEDNCDIIITDINMPNMKSNTSISEPYEGFIRGNMFENLYEQYKN